MFSIVIGIQLIACIQSYRSIVPRIINHALGASPSCCYQQICYMNRRITPRRRRQLSNIKHIERKSSSIKSSLSDTINDDIEISNQELDNATNYASIIDTLSGITDPYDGDNIVEGGLVTNIVIKDNRSVSFDLVNKENRNTFMEDIKNLCLLELSMLEWVS